MIILKPKCRLSRDMLIRDEAALSQKINDREAVVIIPGEYDIVGLDDTCKLVEVEKKYNETPLSELVSVDLTSKDSITKIGNLLLKNKESGLNG